MSLKRTKNQNLQNQLNEWIEKCNEINILELNSIERRNKINEFCLSFVPRDVTTEECEGYAESLISDEV